MSAEGPFADAGRSTGSADYSKLSPAFAKLVRRGGMSVIPAKIDKTKGAPRGTPFQSLRRGRPYFGAITISIWRPSSRG